LTNEWFDVFFVNGFEEQEAKEFMNLHLKARNLPGTDAMDDKAWASVFEVGFLHRVH
jgi:hypothetical protein